MNPLAWVPLRWWLIVGAVLGLLAGIWAWSAHQRGLGFQEGALSVKVLWDKARVMEVAAADKARAAAESETQRRIEAVQEIAHVATLQTARVQADADRARTAADGLRRQLAAFVATSRGAASDPPAVGSGPPAGDALDVLADLLSRSDEAAGQLAAAADAAHIAGVACEQSYGALIRAAK
jgi:hypothetical protein